VNGDSKSTMKGVLPWLIYWVCRAGIRVFRYALVALVGPVQNIFFLTVHSTIPLSPSPSYLGRQSCWVACLLVCVSGVRTVAYNHRICNLTQKHPPQCQHFSFSLFRNSSNFAGCALHTQKLLCLVVFAL
jgi:hypothetical protein